MQPLLVSKNPIFSDVGTVERCCVNSDWTRAAVLTAGAESSTAAAAAAQQYPLSSMYSVGFPSAPILLSERSEAPVPVKLLSKNAVADFCWCSKDPVLYAVGDDGMTLYCYSFDQQQQHQQQQSGGTEQQQQEQNCCEFAIPTKSPDMAWATAVPSEIVEAACLSSTSYSRDEPTPVSSDTAAPALSNMSFGSDRRIVQLRTDPARIGVWVQLRSLLVSLQFVYRPAATAAATLAGAAAAPPTMKLHCIASRRVPMRASTQPPRWCAGPTSVVTLDFDTSELIVWDISGSSAVVQAHIPVNVPKKDTEHISLHFGGDRVDTIIIFNGAAKEVMRTSSNDDASAAAAATAAAVGGGAITTVNIGNKKKKSTTKTSTRATATWLDLSHEERRHSIQSRSRCQRPSRFDPSSLAAHDPAALMLQPVTDSNKFYSWNAFKSRFDPSLRHMFANSLCFFDSSAAQQQQQQHDGEQNDDDEIVTSQLLELHTFESTDAGMCVFALLKLSRRLKKRKQQQGGATTAASSISSNKAIAAASFLAVVVSAKDNAKVDEVAFPLPSVPIEHAGPFIGTTGTSTQINSLHLCAPILSPSGVAAVAFEGAVGGTNGGATASDAAAAALISSLNDVAGGADAAAAAATGPSSSSSSSSSLNSLIQRFAHRAAGATRVLCRINDWDDASVRDATIALAAQSGAVALSSELFGLLESDEDTASAVAACSTLHKLFAARYRELDMEDSAAREPFENLVLTAIRFGEQLVLKLFAHQQHFLMRQNQGQSTQQQQQQQHRVPTTRLRIGTVSEVRLVEQACKSDDLVLFSNGGGTSATATGATDATSLAASLLEGWCRMLECVRSSTHLKQGQQPQFADAILTRVADLRQQQQQQHQQKSQHHDDEVDLVKRALKLVHQGRVSAAVQHIHLLLQQQQQQQQQQQHELWSSSASLSAFAQARCFVDSVAAHVLSCVGSSSSSNSYTSSDFATVVGCLSKCFPNRKAREAWIRAVILSTDSFVVRNRLVASSVLLLPGGELLENDEEEEETLNSEQVAVLLASFFDASTSSSSSTAASPFVLSLIRQSLALLGTSSGALGKQADFVLQKEQLSKSVMCAALPRTSWSPVLFRAVEKKRAKKGIQQQQQQQHDNRFSVTPSSVPGVVSTFPLRVLDAIAADSAAVVGADVQQQQQQQLFLAAAIERAVFDLLAAPASCSSSSLLLESLRAIADKNKHQLGTFARAALSFAVAHIDFSVAACAGALLRELKWKPSSSSRIISQQLFSSKPTSSSAHRIHLAFAAACGHHLAEETAAAISVPRAVVTFGAAAPPPLPLLFFGAQLLHVIINNKQQHQQQKDDLASLRFAFQLYADSAPSNYSASHELWGRTAAALQKAGITLLSNGGGDEEEGSLSQWFEDEHLIRACVPSTVAEFLAVSDAVLRRSRSGQKQRALSSLELLLAELVCSVSMPPRGRGLRPHSEAFAACCVLNDNNSGGDQHQRAIFCSVNSSSQQQQQQQQQSDSGLLISSASSAAINDVVDGFVSGDFTKLRNVYLTQSCVQLLGGSGADADETASADSTDGSQAKAEEDDEFPSSAERIRQKQERHQQRKQQQPRWVVLLKQLRIMAAAEEAKKAGVSIEQCLNACQEILMAPAQMDQQQQQQQQQHSSSSPSDQNHLVAPLLSKIELAEAHTLMFLVELGFAEYARSIHRSFQLGKEEMSSSSPSSSSSSSPGSVDRASGIAPWLCTICSDAPEDGDDDGPASSNSNSSSGEAATSSEQRSKFRDDAKSHFWSRILQHAFAARISPKFLFELLGAVPSLQAAVYPEMAVRAAAIDGTSWGRKICTGVNTRAFIRDMGAEILQQQKQKQGSSLAASAHVGMPFARCILLALNASRTTDQIATQLETFLTTTTATFAAALSEGPSSSSSSSSSTTGLNLSVIASTLLKLFSLQPFPFTVAYRVVVDIAENSGVVSSSNSSKDAVTLSQLCVFVKHLADECFDAAAGVASQFLHEDDLVDLLSSCPAFADWLRLCVARLCQQQQQQQQQQSGAVASSSSTPTGTLRSSAALFRNFPAIGERIYKSPHGAADAIVALDDAVQEALHEITTDEASQQRDRGAVPRLESLLHVVARDLNRNATEAHLSADFTSKVWSACDNYESGGGGGGGGIVGAGVPPTPSAGGRDGSSLHAAAGVSSRGAMSLSSSASFSRGGGGGGQQQHRRFRNGEEVWRYFREEFVEAALFPGSPWSSEEERGFFIEQIFQDWSKKTTTPTSQQQQQSLEEQLEKKRRAGDIDESLLDPVEIPPNDDDDDGAAAAAAAASQSSTTASDAALLFSLLYSETAPPLSEAVFRKTSGDNIAGLLIWLVAFSLSPGDLTPEVVLRLVAIRLAAIKAKATTAAATSAAAQRPGAAVAGGASASSSSSSSSGTALAEQRLRHIHTVVTSLRSRMTEQLLYYILTACLCTEVLELEVEGHLLRLQRDACPTFDDVIGGEKPSLDQSMLSLFDSTAQSNFFFKQWIGRMFSVPREALAKFGPASSSSSSNKTDSNKPSLSNPGLEQQKDAALAQMLSPFVGEERAEEIAAMSFMSVSNASNLLRDVLSTPCASWSDTVLISSSSSSSSAAAAAAAAGGGGGGGIGSSTTEDESRYLLSEKIRVSDKVLSALEKSAQEQIEKEQQQQQQQHLSQQHQQQNLLTPQQQATMLNLICNGIFAAWVVPLLGYRGGDDASRIAVWATRNLNVLSEAYQSAKEHFTAASEQFRTHAASLHWAHEVETLARVALVLRRRHGKSFPSLSALLVKLFDLLARMEDALAGAVDDGCFAEARLFLAAVGWRLVDDSSSMKQSRKKRKSTAVVESDSRTKTKRINSSSILPWDTTLVSKVLDEADASLNALVNRGDLAPIGRFVFAVHDAPWILTPVLHHLLQVGEYQSAFIVPLAIAANIAAPTTRSLASSCTRLALLHYFLAASDFAVEVCGTADMYSFFGHNAPLAEGFEFESWSMLLSLMDTQKKASSSNKDAQQKKLEKLLDEVTASFEQSAESFFRADLFDRAFNCVLVVRLLDSLKRNNKSGGGGGGISSSKITEAALGGMSESMATTLRQQGVALPPGAAGGTSAPDVQRRHSALEAAKTVTDPQSLLLLGCGAEFNADEWAHAIQHFVITAASSSSSGSSSRSAAASGAGLGRVSELGRLFKSACITVGADLPARMRALLPSMTAGTVRTVWEELVALLENASSQ